MGRLTLDLWQHICTCQGFEICRVLSPSYFVLLPLTWFCCCSSRFEKILAGGNLGLRTLARSINSISGLFNLQAAALQSQVFETIDWTIVVVMSSPMNKKSRPSARALVPTASAAAGGSQRFHGSRDVFIYIYMYIYILLFCF